MGLVLGKPLFGQSHVIALGSSSSTGLLECLWKVYSVLRTGCPCSYRVPCAWYLTSRLSNITRSPFSMG